MEIINNNKPNLKSFLKLRSQINRVFFVILMMAYVSFYFLVVPLDTPYPSMIFTTLVTPLLVFAFYFRASTYLFVRNWYHAIYLLVATATYLYALTFVVRDYEGNVGGYEFSHALYGSIIGVCTAIALSIPFKLVHAVIFEVDFYYHFDAIDGLEKEAFPEKYAKEVEKKKEIHKYNLMNETQLQAEYSNAIKEERYEDAGKIKKILDTKFR